MNVKLYVKRPINITYKNIKNIKTQLLDKTKIK